MPVLPISLPIAIDARGLEEFCTRWKIAKLELFGSALRADFRDDSDLDLLVTFDPDAAWSLLDHVRMERELSEMVGRKIDLVSRRAVEASHNTIRRSSILGGAVTVYVSG